MKSVYFLSDAHLGSLAIPHQRMQERRLVRFLDSIKDKAAAIYLLGDMFDFWYEYRYVVPKGFTRFLGKVSELTDMGVEVHYFTGNHDIWAYEYLEKSAASSCTSNQRPPKSTAMNSSWPTATVWVTPTPRSRLSAPSSTTVSASGSSQACTHDGASVSGWPGPVTAISNTRKRMTQFIWVKIVSTWCSLPRSICRNTPTSNTSSSAIATSNSTSSWLALRAS